MNHADTGAGLDLVDVSLRHTDGEETVTALDAVTLSVAPGEFVAVVGPSGAGKSSLLAVAGGLATPDEGSVRIGETELTGLSKAELTTVRRRSIGFVFQTGNLVPALTAIDQLRLPLTFAKHPDARDPQQTLEEVGMGHRSRRRPHQLSGGERQRVGIARALVIAPKVLLVDEPTAALDRERSHAIVELLAREAHQHGDATVMVTHDQDVLRHCDAVYEMIDGRLGLTAGDPTARP